MLKTMLKPFLSFIFGVALKTTPKNILIITLSISLGITLSACSSLGDSSDSNLGGTHFYSLSSLAPGSSSNNQLRIGVGPLEIPRLISRPQIVSRKTNNEIIMAEKHQWGGSLKEDLLQVISDNLSTLLSTENIEQYPWKFAFKPQYQVRINIERFDGQLGKKVVLQARWRLISHNKELLVKRTVITTPVSGKSYNAYVKAQSQALKTFSQKIAAAIKRKQRR